RQLVCNCVRPPEIVDGLGLDAMQIDEANEEGAVRVEQACEMWRVEPDSMLFDFPHDSPHALVAFPDFTTRAPWFGRGYFCRLAHDFTNPAPAFCCRRAWRFSRLASALVLRRASLIFRSMFILTNVECRRAVWKPT